MINWMGKYRDLLTANHIRTFMNVVYVDNKNWAGDCLEMGRRWSDGEGKMVWREDWEREDKDRDEPKDRRTLRELRCMANSIEDDIKMKEDVAGNHSCKILPMLDVQMWVKEGQMVYKWCQS